MTWRKKAFIVVGILISLLCLRLAFRGIAFSDLRTSLLSADVRWILLALALYCVGYALRSYRWHLLISPVKAIPTRELFSLLIIGFFANNVLPFRMGEIVRAHLTGRKFRLSRTASLGTIFIERIYDTISFLTTFLAVALFYPFPHYVEKGALLLGSACAAAILGLWVLMTHQDKARGLLQRVRIPQRIADKAVNLVENFADGVSGLRDWRMTACAMGLSLLIWIIEGSFLYLIAKSFHLSLTIPGSFFVLFFLGLSVTLPQGPGYVGTLELFGVTALTILSIPKESGLAMILTVHGLQFVFIGILGIWAMFKEGLSLHKLTASAEE